MNVRHAEQSVVHSDHSNPTQWLWEIGMQAAQDARLKHIYPPNTRAPDAVFFNVYPGEHYKLLQALCEVLDASKAVEIGTFTGMGTYMLSLHVQKVDTFDLVAWDEFEHSQIDHDLIDSGKVVQHLADLSDTSQFDKYRNLLEDADLIFLDGPKDGTFEYKLWPLLQTLKPKSHRLLLVDDIRLMPMIHFWNNIQYPKMDMTSLGHWSGTGLVDLSRP